jgi:hypothetical protein
MSVKVVKIYPILHNKNKYKARGTADPVGSECYEWSQDAVVYETMVEFEVKVSDEALDTDKYGVKAPKPGLCLRQHLTIKFTYYDYDTVCGQGSLLLHEVFPLSDGVSIFHVQDVHRFGFAWTDGCEINKKDPSKTRVCRFTADVEGAVRVCIATTPDGTPIGTSDIEKDKETGERTGSAVVLSGKNTTTDQSGKVISSVDAAGKGGTTLYFTDDPEITYFYSAEIPHCKDADEIRHGGQYPGDIPAGQVPEQYRGEQDIQLDDPSLSLGSYRMETPGQGPSGNLVMVRAHDVWARQIGAFIVGRVGPLNIADDQRGERE